MSMLYDKVCEAEEHQNAQTHMYILNEDSITVLYSSDKEITKKNAAIYRSNICGKRVKLGRC